MTFHKHFMEEETVLAGKLYENLQLLQLLQTYIKTVLRSTVRIFLL